MSIDPKHYARFEAAIGSAEPFAALHELAKALQAEGVTQFELYRLYFRYQQRLALSPEEDQRYDAVLDNLELIDSGSWAKGQGLFPSALPEEQARALPREPQPPWVDVPRWAVATPQIAVHEDRAVLENEARMEVGPDHELWGKDLIAIARRLDCDDVLFAVRGSAFVAQLHLTWSGKQESGRWPIARVFPSILEWFDETYRSREE